MRGLQQYCLAFALLQSVGVVCFQPIRSSLIPSSSMARTTALYAKMDETELKAELTEYLKKRDEANADDLAKA